MPDPVPVTGSPILGRDQGVPFGYQGEGSLLTVAQAGSGKDRCVILPNLIRYRGSMIVVDPKGADADDAAAWRLKMGQAVHVYDPYGVTDPAKLPAGCLATFNPLDVIRTSRTPIEDAKVISAAIVYHEERQPHFSNGARQLCAGVMVYVALDPAFEGKRTMATVWRAMRSGMSDAAMGENGEVNAKDDKFRQFLQGMAKSKVARGYAAGEANAFLRMNSKEAAQFLSTLYTNCGSILDSPAILDNMASSSVDFGSLQTKPATVFLVLPGSLADTHARWFRLLLGCAFMQIERAGLAPVAGQAKPAATLFILNEFFTLGKFPQIVEAMGRMRGYGVKFWSFVQNLSQLKQHYGDAWTNITGNAGVIQYFGGSGDVFTMEYISKLSGLRSAGTISTSENEKGGQSVSQGTMSRPVMYPDEVGRLKNGTQFISRAGEQPGYGTMLYVDKDFEDHRHEMLKLGELKFICPVCGAKVAKVHKPNPRAPELRIDFPCHGLAVIPHAGPGWRSMRPGETRETGKLYRSSSVRPDVWDVFSDEGEEIAEPVEDAPAPEEIAPLDAVGTVRASAAPVEEAALEAALLVPFGTAEPRLVMLSRWLVSGLLVFVALEPRWSFDRDTPSLLRRIAFDHDLFREFVEVVTLSDVADGYAAQVAKAYLAGDEDEAAAIHLCLRQATAAAE